MARRRIVPHRGWLIEGGNPTLTYSSAGPTWANDVLVAHSDISEDISTVEREKSDYYFKRIILEMRLTYVPTGTGNPFGVPVGVRIGTVADDIPLQTTLTQVYNSFDFNEWTHILRDESFMAWDEAALVKDGGALAVNTAPTGDGQTYPVPGVIHKWDLSVNLGLMEDHSLIIGWGPWVAGLGAPANGDEFGCEWKLKALLQKRRT